MIHEGPMTNNTYTYRIGIMGVKFIHLIIFTIQYHAQVRATKTGSVFRNDEKIIILLDTYS